MWEVGGWGTKLHFHRLIYTIRMLANEQLLQRWIAKTWPLTYGNEAAFLNCMVTNRQVLQQHSLHAYLVSQNQGSPVLTASAMLVNMKNTVSFQQDSFHFLSLSCCLPVNLAAALLNSIAFPKGCK
jgi:hypothetical protein